MKCLCGVLLTASPQLEGTGPVMSSLDFPTDNSYVQRPYSPNLAIK